MKNVAADSQNREWFAVQVRANRERASAQHLQQRGYQVFLPQACEWRHWSDRTKKVARALFPGYLFCREDSTSLERVVTSPGVIRIINDGHRPVPVSSIELDAIQRIVAAPVIVEPWPSLQPGQRVRVENGPLRGTEGVVVASDHSRRLIVGISLLQRSVAVEMAADWLSIILS